MLWTAFMAGHIKDKTVADFGCGTGILGIGAILLGAKHVAFVELDERVFPTLYANLKYLEEFADEDLSNYEIIQGNVAQYDRAVDTVIQNPPFGTKVEHADLVFLEKATTLAPVVYSLHKTSTKEFLLRWGKEHKLTAIEAAAFRFPLKQTMEHHTKRMEHIDVSCLVFRR
jgi:putative methylase